MGYNMPTLRSLPVGVQLRRRSTTASGCTNIPALKAWLLARGYTSQPTRTSIEFARLRHGNSLIILWHNGSVCAQGSDHETAVRLLRQLEGAS